jgi:hypothetical protein
VAEAAASVGLGVAPAVAAGLAAVGRRTTLQMRLRWMPWKEN